MYFIAVKTQNMGLREDQTEKKKLTELKKDPMKFPKIQYRKTKLWKILETKAVNDQV